MANEVMGKKLRYMSQNKFETITEADDEFYAVSGSGIGFPSSRYEDLTLGASDTEYTAPANGYFFLSKATGSNYAIVAMTNMTKDYMIRKQNYNTDLDMLFSVQKGDVVRIFYTASGTTNYFRFIYAEGE